MAVELFQNPLVIAGAAFLLGWILAFISGRRSAKKKAAMRDPRDLRIRSLEAEGRIAQAELDKTISEAEGLETELKKLAPEIERRDNIISEQQCSIDQLRSDLTGSVKKTRELRAELADRATENVHAEAKIREVETELSIVQASTDLISTGMFDYGKESDEEDDDKTAVL